MDNKSLRIIIFIQILLVSTEFLPSSAKPLRATDAQKRSYEPDFEDETVLTTDKNLNDDNENFDNDSTRHGVIISGNDKQTKLRNTLHDVHDLKSDTLGMNRQNRDQENEEYDDIQSKDEKDDEDDVQLIIIPKKQHKKMKNLESKNGDSVDGDSEDGDSEDSDSEDGDFEHSDSENSDPKSEKDFSSSDEIKEQFRRLEKKLIRKIMESKEKPVENDNSISLERVDQGKKAETGDYDLHVNVKDNTGTKVKLSGDLPGNLGNLVAEGDGGGKVQVEDTKKNKPALSITSEDNDATEEDIADSVVKTRQGKQAHAPYSSAVLFRPSSADVQDPDGTLAQNNRARDTAMSQQLSVLKNEDQDRYLSHEVSKGTLAPPSLATQGGENRKMTNQQPDNNVFSEMHLDDADDELVATSRLLDIARKADDQSALKDGKESQSIKPQTIAANTEIGKPKTLSTENVQKRISPEDVDKESQRNWYKMQALEDRVVREGSTAKNGQEVGSYNGQDVSVLSPGQLQLQQTEYPSYPAYMTPLLRNKLRNSTTRKHAIIKAR